MTGFSKGGIIPGPGFSLRLVAECSPDGQGSFEVLYADECVINKDGLCIRNDDMHKAVPITADRFWICPLHD